MTIPRGVYRISQWGSFEGRQVLTNIDGIITVSPLGAHPEKAQEWLVEPLQEGNVAIQNTAIIFPSHSLSFNGEPKAGARVVPGPLSDFPTRAWRVVPAPQKPFLVPYFIHVPNEDLIVAISPTKIHPPQVVLANASVDLKHAWVFELLRSQ